MLLQHERPFRSLAKPPGRAMRNLELLVIVNLHTIEIHGRHGVLRLLAIRIEPWCVKVDIEGLPGERWKTRADAGASVFGTVVETCVR